MHEVIRTHGGRLVPCICLDQALEMQWLEVWLPGQRFGPGRQHAKAASEPGSRDARLRRLKSVYPEAGSRDAAY
jgi:hypothetical protein